jgi:hypothetical protein
MGARGPKSVAARLGPIIPAARPAPPPDLEEDEAAEWLKITATLPPNWFSSENFCLLRELCRHIRFARDLAKRISELRHSETLDDDGTAQLLKLMRAHGVQSERIGTISTKLRLTQQSRFKRSDIAEQVRKRSGAGVKPWLDWGHADDADGDADDESRPPFSPIADAPKSKN